MLSTVYAPYDGESDWHEHAACKGAGDLFWNEYDDEDNPRVEYERNLRIAKAKQICWSCPVIAECRRWGIEVVGSEDRFTILGGLTWSQRKAFLTKYRKSRVQPAQEHPDATPRIGSTPVAQPRRKAVQARRATG